MGKKLFDLIWSWISKLPPPYLIMIFVVGLGGIALTSSRAKEFQFGPEWNYSYEAESGTAVFHTGTELKSGEIIVKAQLEIKYKEKVCYILEVRGLYNTNQIRFQDVRPEETEGSKASKFCLTIEKTQRDKLDAFEENFKELLEEHLKDAYQDDFHTVEFELEENLVAEIKYQSIKMNRSESMYISVSGEEVSTVSKKEVTMRSANTFIDLDELNLNKSFYTNEKIMSIMEECVIEIDKGMR